ncbi:MAG: hypothetical protein ACD_75C00374G0004 [uncultured bacterium]|nr:MAG: hypothetical protein ACD_75C00374G0004 [uncultured bacterium]
MKKCLWLFLAILSLLPCPGCEKKSVPKQPVKIGIDIWAGYAYAFIAREKGFFTKNGVNVELVLRDTTLETRKAYINHEIDGIFGLFSDMLMQNSEGTPARLVLVIDRSVKGDMLVGRPQFQTLRDLQGKTVGIEGINTFSHIFVLKLLENAGLQESEVKFKNINGRDVLTALEEGQIDAGHTWDPVKTAALNKGYRMLAHSGDLPGILIDGLFFRPEVIKGRPDDIRLIIKSLLEARAYAHANWDEAIALMAKAEGMPYEAMQNGVLGVKHLDLKDNVEVFRKSEDMGSLYWSFKTIVDFFITRGQMTMAPKFAEFIEPQFVMRLWQEEAQK